MLSIGNQSTSIRNGHLHVDHDNDEKYILTFDRSYFNVDIGGSLFGLDLDRLQLSISSDNNDLYDDSLPNKIPTSAYFAQRADRYNISVFLEKGQRGGLFGQGDYRSMSFVGYTKLFPSFTLESDGGNSDTPTPIPTPTPTPIPTPTPTPTPTPEPTPVRQLTGTNGRDRLTGDTGDDVLTGLGGNDILNGEAGRDRLIGGIGKDTLTGGADADQFVFDIGRSFKQSPIGVDVITDFQRPDKIVLDRTTFTALRGNRASFQSVKTVGKAQNSRALITYIRSTGALFYNQNGKAPGFGQGGQFADFKNGLNLAASDFIVQS